MNQNKRCHQTPDITDYGPNPLIVNIERAARANPYYRTALWTGNHLQVTLMSIKAGGDIGLEMHPNLDQFIQIESGHAYIKMGNRRESMKYRKRATGGYAVIIPAGTWHNIINIGNTPLKLYSVYAPVQHPFGTIHKTKEDAEASEKHKS
jgi:mannose-6-phosphate isomerase-like protein (cupin superfamily)